MRRQRFVFRLGNGRQNFFKVEVVKRILSARRSFFRRNVLELVAQSQLLETRTFDGRGNLLQILFIGLLAFDGLANGSVNCLENFAFVGELEFNFLRVNVHIDGICRHVNFHDGKRKTGLRDKRLVRLVDGFGNRAAFDDAPVDDKRLPTAITLQDVRLRDAARKFQVNVINFERQQRFGQLRAVNRAQSVKQVAVAGRGNSRAVPVDETEGDFGSAQRKFDNKVVNAVCLRRRGFQELQSCGHVEKQFFDDDACAALATDFVRVDNFPAVD